MINLQKLHIHQKYGGDSDGFERCGTANEKSIITIEEWLFLSDNLQNIEMIKKELVSQSFSNSILSNLKESCDIETFQLLIKDIQLTL